MRARRALVTLMGALQSIIGMLVIVFAYLIYYDPPFFQARSILNIQIENIAFFIFLLSIIGFFSLLSGFLIIYEWTSKE